MFERSGQRSGDLDSAQTEIYPKAQVTSHLTESSNRSYAGERHTFAPTTENQIVIRNSQLLLVVIQSLLLIGAGLIGFGKKTDLTAAMM